MRPLRLPYSYRLIIRPAGEEYKGVHPCKMAGEEGIPWYAAQRLQALVPGLPERPGKAGFPPSERDRPSLVEGGLFHWGMMGHDGWKRCCSFGEGRGAAVPAGTGAAAPRGKYGKCPVNERFIGGRWWLHGGVLVTSADMDSSNAVASKRPRSLHAFTVHSPFSISMAKVRLDYQKSSPLCERLRNLICFWNVFAQETGGAAGVAREGLRFTAGRAYEHG